MDLMTAAASAIKSLAWPTLVGVVFFQLRGEIRSLLTRVTQASGYGVKLKFSEDVVKVQSLVDAAPAKKVEMAYDAALVERPQLKIDNLGPASSGPRYIVEEVWSWVRASLNADAQSRGMDPSKIVHASQLARRLKISPPLIEALDGLERLRNEVTHTPIPPLSLEDANQFRAVAESLVRKL